MPPGMTEKSSFDTAASPGACTDCVWTRIDPCFRPIGCIGLTVDILISPRRVTRSNDLLHLPFIREDLALCPEDICSTGNKSLWSFSCRTDGSICIVAP